VLVACESTTPSSSLVSDDAIEADVLASAGEAIASTLDAMAGNEANSSLPGSNVRSDLPALTSSSLDVERSRTCYDANDEVLDSCAPLSAVRKVVTEVSLDGSRSGSHTTRRGVTVNWSGAVHRVLDDTLVRNFTGTTEVSRTHSAIATGNDTSTFTGEGFSRVISEATIDSVNAVTWNVPRANNPFPISGSIVRVDTLHAVASRGGDTFDRQVVWTIRVSFPADAQGNVVLQVNDKTCNLNLVTHAVSNCQ
jgi:hypothetical protein